MAISPMGGSWEPIFKFLQSDANMRDESRFLVYAAVFLEVTVISSEVSITRFFASPSVNRPLM